MSEEFKDGDQALPMYNPDAMQTLSGFVDTMFMLHDIKVEHCLPAKIVSYDRKTNLATVQPIVKYTVNTSDGKKYIDRTTYENIYVLNFGSSKYNVSIPLKAGDTGMLVACDRNWTTARKENSSTNPDENKGAEPSDDDSYASFQHGVFVPTSFADCNVPDDAKEALVIKAGVERNVIIDSSDLPNTDARFRDAIVLVKETDAKSGKNRFVYRLRKVLSDDGTAYNSEDVDVDTSSVVALGNSYFSIYAPENEEGYTIRAGRVCIDDDKFVDVEPPTGQLDPSKEYYCCVKITLESGIIGGAEIVSFDKIEKKEDETEREKQERIQKENEQFADYQPSDFGYYKRWFVPIGHIDEDGNVTQYHVGAINLSSGKRVIPDFKIYVSGYDEVEKRVKYGISSGKVYANGKTATADAVLDIDQDSTYRCKVAFDMSSEALTATITNETPTTSGTSLLWWVDIGSVSSGEINQDHIGSVQVSVPNHTLKINGNGNTKFLSNQDLNIVMPVVNDGTLTIKTEGHDYSFTANDPDDVTVDLRDISGGVTAPFSCLRQVEESGGERTILNDVEFFLPSGSAFVNGVSVDFTQDFTVKHGDWKVPNTPIASGDVYCWIGSTGTITGNHYAHFSATPKTLGIYDDTWANQLVRACFKVCTITNGQGDPSSTTEGILQIALGAAYCRLTTIDGDTGDSEVIDGDIDITGQIDPDDAGTSCGIEFKTISARNDDGFRKPRIVADLKGRDDSASKDDWKVHELKYKDGDTSKSVYFLGDSDLDITDSTGGGGGSHSITNVVGSEYIDVTTQTSVSGVQQRKVVAKTDTANPKPNDEHALLTHDTDQFVRCAKVFTGNGDSGASKRIKIDGPNGKLEAINAGGNKIIRLDAGDMPDDCQGPITVHKIKYKDTNGDTQIYHGLFCDDIDLTKEGKLIKDVSLSPSSASGGFNKIVFTYTDDTYDEVTIQNGINGSQGPQGADGLDGETPEITSTDIAPGKHAIMADGEQIAIISDGADGTSPVITMGEGTGNPKTYKIFSNGTEIGSVHDGADGTITEPLTETNIVTDISFSVSNGKIMATVTKAKAKVINYSSLGQSNVDVCSIVNQDVVVSSSYNGTGNERKFVNSVKSVGVLSVGNASESPVFTATPLDL